ncbi:cobalt-zinc-cadmium resistance protein CzcA [Filimonas lacunae]|uniref:Cobalt-zinc-cadmium resistance protein CzcA n=1 Tax=Filimonas lacunae TaxID=477680 RepID=A0A173MQ99_9BACT|nr:CusA/CzcA family heavy metal efflux RND transporter [Filimonas lacunae]BAV09666.1 cobalt-zinc-cadmium resistance protein CzcA [Filimonas lacunae]SIS76843.1 cobalt-zinc-cadmium resistance protein CzcA [Filimonas lacunae]
MLNRIIRFSVENKLIIGLLMIGWIVYGVFEVTRLPIDAVPDITNNQVQVITNAPALGATDVERLITFPIEQANNSIPGLVEMRSLSRFGLSIVTMVFNDDADVYWARQQVSERMQTVSMPDNAGTPQLAPVTTGLGEIYQYVVRAKPGYESKYTLADLRTIQDWMIRRQLLGTKGVADVSTFGGELKQYEVAVNPAQLKAFNLTISDVFNALHLNNENTGGAYIEKGPSVLFIRSEGLVGNISDIENIVVKTTNTNAPVLIKHIAQVQTGAATRYGALCYNTQGEVTGAIVMMLKGENSSAVIKNVKERITAIQKTLPEGIVIEPFLDRTKMVNNAIGTVEHNLLEGAVIVILVLVLFLGNFRAGFIVASVIPLSMLFAIIMMNTFGVSGNLMSLGALDFGLIVDGAVIIVEAVLHHLQKSKKYTSGFITQDQMNAEVSNSASRMMNAAVFGQIIILIVYLPILSLQGIEGKMFKPMAQTVAFAIIGAFILSLTYVPMISSLVLSRKISNKPTFADKMMAAIERVYKKALNKALHYRKTVIGVAVLLLVVSAGVFSTLGGEFIPQLEEGDFAVESRLLTGTNLNTTIRTTQQMSKILLDSFPEVEKVVTRVGSAEIPTDPMPIEGGDVIIVLKDKKEWTSATSFTEMADKMTEKIHAIPGVTTGFQFPVQMRFNEMMTGAKQDVICKIFGENLDTLAAYAGKLAAIANTVKGTTDMYVETVTGMPQIVVNYNRSEIAKYGLSVQEINRTINAAFAGAAAGQVYEGEKRFDLVVRAGVDKRKSMEDVNNLLIATPGGVQVPLYQLAEIKQTEGPAQIQREDAKRRIIVGFNVRGRDVQSIVTDLQEKVNKQLKMQAGYYTTYGGSFENLQQAKQRLSIALPIALVLIFLMLYFAFHSVKEGVLIYTAIPLSAIGGILALWMRGMPFSISAGVGFIALFGVAVLNGIVLISEFNRLKKDGATDTWQIILHGTQNRLRPVLMTAAVASLGFLPMALSDGAGAEVQRPLATVVIGGLITATLLTLFVLPALFLAVENRKRKKGVAPVTLAVLLLLSVNCLQAQTPPGYRPVSLEQSITLATTNNLQMQQAKLGQQHGQQLKKSWLDMPKTSITGEYGQYNSAKNDLHLGVSQSFNFPSVYSNQKKALNENYLQTIAQTQLTRQNLKAEVKRMYYEAIWLQEKKKLLQYADSIYSLFLEKAALRLKTGESNLLEKATAQTQRQQIQNQLGMLESDIIINLQQFNLLLNDSVAYAPQTSNVLAEGSVLVDTSALAQLPQMQLLQHQANAAEWQWKTEKAKLLPDFVVGYNNQTMKPEYGNSLNYVNAGIGIPLFSGAQSARAAASKTEWERLKVQNQQAQLQTRTEVLNAQQQVQKYAGSLRYYQQEALPNTQVIVSTADKQFVNGEIDYLQWTILVNQTIGIRNEYIDAVNNYNQSVITLQKITNKE